MRTPFVAGNWKMNKTISEARALVSEMVPSLKEIKGVEKVICPPFTSIQEIAGLLRGADIGLGAQNMHWEMKGAYTGEIAPGMVVENCNYVIIGHSERRKWFGETDETVNKKVMTALKVGLVPIVCVGETEKEYDSHQTGAVVTRQLRGGLKEVPLENANKLVIAYEPVWAIGTGRASSGENAEEVINRYIRQILGEIFSEKVAQTIRILYGGSVTPENAKEFFTQPNIDGALVGGSSLKADDFISIVKAALKP